MDDEAIRRLLERADGAFAPLPPSADLGGRIRRRARRQLVSRTSLGFIVCGLLAGGIAWLSRGGADPTSPGHVARAPLPEQEVAQLRSQLAQLNEEARLQDRVLEQLERRRNRPSLAAQARAEVINPVTRIQDERNRAALILVQQAQRLQKERKRPERAAEEYRQVIEFFPGTPWADIARERLKEIDRKEG